MTIEDKAAVVSNKKWETLEARLDTILNVVAQDLDAKVAVVKEDHNNIRWDIMTTKVKICKVAITWEIDKAVAIKVVIIEEAVAWEECLKEPMLIVQEAHKPTVADNFKVEVVKIGNKTIDKVVSIAEEL